MRAALDRATYLRLLRQLAPRPLALPTCLVLALDLALTVLSVWLAGQAHWPSRCAAAGLMSIILLHFYLIHHECTHRSVFASPRHNIALGEALGWVLGLPFHARSRSHLRHHAWTGHLERDPANARARARLARLGPRPLLLLELAWRGWIPLLALNERIGLWRSALSVTQACPHRIRERACARLLLATYGLALALCVFSSSIRALFGTYLAAQLLLLIWEELINLPHHLEAPTVTRKMPLWEQIALSHSCRGVPFWSSVVLLHFNQHAAHHAFPGLPWFRLPEAARALQQVVACAEGEHELGWSVRLRRSRFRDVFAAYLR